MHLPGSPRVYAFDVNPAAQSQVPQLAHENQVNSRVTVEGFCDPPALAGNFEGAILIVCDCEGYEVEILQPRLTPALAQADILVELHDLKRSGVTPTLMGRFAPTHDIALIDTAQRKSL